MYLHVTIGNVINEKGLDVYNHWNVMVMMVATVWLPCGHDACGHWKLLLSSVIFSDAKPKTAQDSDVTNSACKLA